MIHRLHAYFEYLLWVDVLRYNEDLLNISLYVYFTLCWYQEATLKGFRSIFDIYSI